MMLPQGDGGTAGTGTSGTNGSGSPAGGSGWTPPGSAAATAGSGGGVGAGTAGSNVSVLAPLLGTESGALQTTSLTRIRQNLGAGAFTFPGYSPYPSSSPVAPNHIACSCLGRLVGLSGQCSVCDNAQPELIRWSCRGCGCQRLRICLKLTWFLCSLACSAPCCDHVLFAMQVSAAKAG